VNYSWRWRPWRPAGAGGTWTLHASTADRERIVQVLTLLEDALSQSDLIPAFDTVARRRP